MSSSPRRPSGGSRRRQHGMHFGEFNNPLDVLALAAVQHSDTGTNNGSEDNADGDVSGEVSGEVGDDADDSAAVVAHGNQVTSAVAMIGSGRVSGISKPRALTSPLSVATTGVVVKDTDTMTPNNNNNTTTTTIVNGTRSKVAALTEAANTTVVVPQSRAVVGTGAKTLTVLRLNPGSTNGGAEHSYAAATTTTTTAASSANRRVASTTETDDEGYSSRSSSLDSPAPGQPARGAEASDALGAEDQDTTEGSAGVQPRVGVMSPPPPATSPVTAQLVSPVTKKPAKIVIVNRESQPATGNNRRPRIIAGSPSNGQKVLVRAASGNTVLRSLLGGQHLNNHVTTVTNTGASTATTTTTATTKTVLAESAVDQTSAVTEVDQASNNDSTDTSAEAELDVVDIDDDSPALATATAEPITSSPVTYLFVPPPPQSSVTVAGQTNHSNVATTAPAAMGKHQYIIQDDAPPTGATTGSKTAATVNKASAAGKTAVAAAAVTPTKVTPKQTSLATTATTAMKSTSVTTTATKSSSQSTNKTVTQSAAAASKTKLAAASAASHSSSPSAATSLQLSRAVQAASLQLAGVTATTIANRLVAPQQQQQPGTVLCIDSATGRLTRQILAPAAHAGAAVRLTTPAAGVRLTTQTSSPVTGVRLTSILSTGKQPRMPATVLVPATPGTLRLCAPVAVSSQPMSTAGTSLLSTTTAATTGSSDSVSTINLKISGSRVVDYVAPFGTDDVTGIVGGISKKAAIGSVGSLSWPRIQDTTGQSIGNNTARTVSPVASDAFSPLSAAGSSRCHTPVAPGSDFLLGSPTLQVEETVVTTTPTTTKGRGGAGKKKQASLSSLPDDVSASGSCHRLHPLIDHDYCMFTEFNADIQSSIIATTESKLKTERKYSKKGRGGGGAAAAGGAGLLGAGAAGTVGVGGGRGVRSPQPMAGAAAGAEKITAGGGGRKKRKYTRRGDKAAGGRNQRRLQLRLGPAGEGAEEAGGSPVTGGESPTMTEQGLSRTPSDSSLNATSPPMTPMTPASADSSCLLTSELQLPASEKQVPPKTPKTPTKRVLRDNRNYVKITGSYQDEFVYFATKKTRGRPRKYHDAVAESAAGGESVGVGGVGGQTAVNPTAPGTTPAAGQVGGINVFDWYHDLSRTDKSSRFGVDVASPAPSVTGDDGPHGSDRLSLPLDSRNHGLSDKTPEHDSEVIDLVMEISLDHFSSLMHSDVDVSTETVVTTPADTDRPLPGATDDLGLSDVGATTDNLDQPFDQPPISTTPGSEAAPSLSLDTSVPKIIDSVAGTPSQLETASIGGSSETMDSISTNAVENSILSNTADSVISSAENLLMSTENPVRTTSGNSLSTVASSENTQMTSSSASAMGIMASESTLLTTQSSVSNSPFSTLNNSSTSIADSSNLSLNLDNQMLTSSMDLGTGSISSSSSSNSSSTVMSSTADCPPTTSSGGGATLPFSSTSCSAYLDTILTSSSSSSGNSLLLDTVTTTSTMDMVSATATTSSSFAHDVAASSASSSASTFLPSASSSSLVDTIATATTSADIAIASSFASSSSAFMASMSSSALDTTSLTSASSFLGCSTSSALDTSLASVGVDTSSVPSGGGVGGSELHYDDSMVEEVGSMLLSLGEADLKLYTDQLLGSAPPPREGGAPNDDAKRMSDTTSTGGGLFDMDQPQTPPVSAEDSLANSAAPYSLAHSAASTGPTFDLDDIADCDLLPMSSAYSVLPPDLSRPPASSSALAPTSAGNSSLNVLFSQTAAPEDNGTGTSSAQLCAPRASPTSGTLFAPEPPLLHAPPSLVQPAPPHHTAQQSPVGSSLVGANPPELCLVSMYWNDLPGLKINGREHVRLVDIHKQMLPAKDTGILKKRCQMMNLEIINCSELQRDFLVRYANAAKSKSTVVVTKEDAKTLVSFYVDPRPRAPRSMSYDGSGLASKASEGGKSGIKLKFKLKTDELKDHNSAVPGGKTVKPRGVKRKNVATVAAVTTPDGENVTDNGRSERTRKKKVNYAALHTGTYEGPVTPASVTATHATSDLTRSLAKIKHITAAATPGNGGEKLPGLISPPPHRAIFPEEREIRRLRNKQKRHPLMRKEREKLRRLRDKLRRKLRKLRNEMDKVRGIAPSGSRRGGRRVARKAPVQPAGAGSVAQHGVAGTGTHAATHGRSAAALLGLPVYQPPAPPTNSLEHCYAVAKVVRPPGNGGAGSAADNAVGSSLSPLGGDEMVEVSSTEFIEVVSPLPPPATPTTDDDVDLQPPPNYTQGLDHSASAVARCGSSLDDAAPIVVLARGGAACQEGRLTLGRYTAPDAACIQCATCTHWLSVRRFLRHLHHRGSSTDPALADARYLEPRAPAPTITWKVWGEFERRRRDFDAAHQQQEKLASMTMTPVNPDDDDDEVVADDDDPDYRAPSSVATLSSSSGESRTSTPGPRVAVETTPTPPPAKRRRRQHNMEASPLPTPRQSGRVRKKKQLHPIESYVFAKDGGTATTVASSQTPRGRRSTSGGRHRTSGADLLSELTNGTSSDDVIDIGGGGEKIR